MLYRCIIYAEKFSRWVFELKMVLCEKPCPSVTESFLQTLPSNVAKCDRMAIQLDEMCIDPADTVRLLGTVLDLHLNRECSSEQRASYPAVHHLHQIGIIRKNITVK